VAEKNRLEIKIIDLEVKITEKKLDIEQKDYYPSISLTGSYYRLGTEWDVNGGVDISNPDSWNIIAVASWNFWEWGKTRYGVKEKLSRLSQIRYKRDAIHDNISLEVKQAYLKTKEAEKKIATVEKAIEQAKENFRINKERYKEQVATSTDVLDAQTLLSRTTTNYYNALYDYKIAKASLYRATGQEVLK
jgi:outer membrane protein TolC